VTRVAKGDSYINFGCGIRANRATDQVTTWWFITSRRIGLDLHLVEGRVPVSRDALRVLLALSHASWLVRVVTR
jgi:hypothetical protein